MSTLRNLSLAMMLGVGLLAGCSSFDGDSRSERSRGDDVRTGRGDVERAAGTKGRLPREARLVDEGRGGNALKYEARDRGTVYLVDRNADVVVWSGAVRDADRVTVNPDKNRIEINGREQANIDLKSDHRFELYFDRSSSR